MCVQDDIYSWKESECYHGTMTYGQMKSTGTGRLPTRNRNTDDTLFFRTHMRNIKQILCYPCITESSKALSLIVSSVLSRITAWVCNRSSHWLADRSWLRSCPLILMLMLSMADVIQKALAAHSRLASSSWVLSSVGSTNNYDKVTVRRRMEWKWNVSCHYNCAVPYRQCQYIPIAIGVTGRMPSISSYNLTTLINLLILIINSAKICGFMSLLEWAEISARVVSIVVWLSRSSLRSLNV